MNRFSDPSDMITPPPPPSSSSSSESLQTAAAADKDVLPWTSIGASMSAISFGFVATAILISMFLIMAIFEHLLRHQQRPSFLLPRNPHSSGGNSDVDGGAQHQAAQQKLASSQNHCDVSVVMPGHKYPTFIAQHAPLPCTREGIRWPPHASDIT